jgi:hypothetical protein
MTTTTTTTKQQHTTATTRYANILFVNTFNNFFPNTHFLPTTTQEIENFIKSLKPMNTYG